MAKKIITESLPLKLIALDKDGYHLMIKVKLNGKVARLVLDTGASKTVFDSHKITRYVSHDQFVKNDQLSTGLGTNTMESHTVIIKKFMLGTLVIPDFNIILLDMAHISQSYEQMGLPAIDGVLGGDILFQFQALIDYKKLVLTLKSNR